MPIAIPGQRPKKRWGRKEVVPILAFFFLVLPLAWAIYEPISAVSVWPGTITFHRIGGGAVTFRYVNPYLQGTSCNLGSSDGYIGLGQRNGPALEINWRLMK